MNTVIPESYRSGLEQIEAMSTIAVREWLDAELRDKIHLLAGKTEDFPVQAIVNHHPYLSLPAQNRIADAIVTLILAWREAPDDYPELTVRALLSLAAELRVVNAKEKLQSLVRSDAFEPAKALCPAILRTIATLSSNDDCAFWRRLPQYHPEYAGMAFQVLTRIGPAVALKLLGELPTIEQSISGVARKLPEFVSKFEPDRQASLLDQIDKAISLLPAESTRALKLALEEEGFDLSENPFPDQEEHRLEFVKKIIIFVKTLQPTSESPQTYAKAR
jgi:hypothetical protein